jgi:hypothetical protein
MGLCQSKITAPTAPTVAPALLQRHDPAAEAAAIQLLHDALSSNKDSKNEREWLATVSDKALLDAATAISALSPKNALIVKTIRTQVNAYRRIPFEITTVASIHDRETLCEMVYAADAAADKYLIQINLPCTDLVYLALNACITETHVIVQHVKKAMRASRVNYDERIQSTA